jgi:hypothetical protein
MTKFGVGAPASSKQVVQVPACAVLPGVSCEVFEMVISESNPN